MQDRIKQQLEQPSPMENSACDANCGPKGGPPRDGGGNTGAGNLSPGGASRTGGSTTGTHGAGQGGDQGKSISPDARR